MLGMVVSSQKAIILFMFVGLCYMTEKLIALKKNNFNVIIDIKPVAKRIRSSCTMYGEQDKDVLNKCFVCYVTYY